MRVCHFKLGSSLTRYLLKAFLLILAVSLGSYSVAADQSANLSAEQWLSKMQKASGELTYRGVFIFTRGNMTSSMRVVHRFQNGLVEERLTQLDGAMGEIVRKGEQVLCVFPDNRIVQVEKDHASNRFVDAFSTFMPERSQYRLILNGMDRLIDRAAVKLSVNSKDQHRYSYQLWIDQETGLMLKSSLLSIEGAQLEKFQYTHIEFPKTISDEELSPMSEGITYKHDMIPSTKVDKNWPGNTKWKATWTPPGFMALMPSDRSGNNVMLYSDGLASFSIFVEMVDDNMMPEGASMVGATVAYAKRLNVGEHHYGVTVVGEVPASTAMKVAESVMPEVLD